MIRLNNKYRDKWSLANLSFFSLAMVLLLTQCEIQDSFEYQKSETSKLDVTAWEFIQSQENLSSMAEAITAAGMESYYSGSSSYTFILPDNTGWSSYLSTNGYSRISDIPVETLKEVIGYHIVNAIVNFSDVELMDSNNYIAYETIRGEIMYLSHDTSWRGYVNAKWLIYTSNLVPTNGVMHLLRYVVYPVDVD
ncbi:MAG: fasciclin domain-containing protein [Mangrovibacterium sp.]